MMRITVEIVPGGNEAEAEVVEQVYVANRAALAPTSATMETLDGDAGGWRIYLAWLGAHDAADTDRRAPDVKVCHLRDDGAVTLAALVLGAAAPPSTNQSFARRIGRSGRATKIVGRR
jgi:hypothetical protein